MSYITRKLAFFSCEVTLGGESAVSIFLCPELLPGSLASVSPIEGSPLFLRFSWLHFSNYCITLENGRSIVD